MSEATQPLDALRHLAALRAAALGVSSPAPAAGATLYPAHRELLTTALDVRK